MHPGFATWLWLMMLPFVAQRMLFEPFGSGVPLFPL
jgi:hypothetical protein